MRDAVKELVTLGKLPREDVGAEIIAQVESALHKIVPPLTDQEAEALLQCFGDDECYGLAWTLLHLIETSATPYPLAAPSGEDSIWLTILYERHRSAQ